jgi:hypothetical protein
MHSQKVPPSENSVLPSIFTKAKGDGRS